MACGPKFAVSILSPRTHQEPQSGRVTPASLLGRGCSTDNEAFDGSQHCHQSGARRRRDAARKIGDNQLGGALGGSSPVVEQMPKVNPDILRWARETAGLTPERAVEKLQLRSARGVSAVRRLDALEEGKDVPTRPMLTRMAKQYRRPLVAFYMSKKPRRGDRGQDFRTLPEGHTAGDEALLDALIRDVHARQGMVRAVLEDEDESVVLTLVGSMAMSDGVPAVVSSIRDTLGISAVDLYAETSPAGAFSLLRSRAEKVGVFVLLMGDLGSHHSSIDVETFRGLALADDVAPFIVINDQDHRAAWSFTLLHELAHIWLGQTGVSVERAEVAIERFCSEVAGEFLLPRQELEQFSLDVSTDIKAIEVRVSEFARIRNLSSTMVAYRLYRAGVIDHGKWSGLKTAFREWWLKARLKQREKARKQEGGPSFYVVRAHRVGPALLHLVGRMVSAGALTTSKAGKVLGVKPKQVQVLLGHSVPGTNRRAT